MTGLKQRLLFILFFLGLLILLASSIVVIFYLLAFSFIAGIVLYIYQTIKLRWFKTRSRPLHPPKSQNSRIIDAEDWKEL